MIRWLVFAFCLASGPVWASDEKLADIRQELSVLYVEIQRLKTELSTTGAPSGTTAGSTLDRVNAIESRLQALTSKTEELEFRIGQIVEDGTRRLADLEFRLIELEGGDLSQLSEGSTLGGEATSPQVGRPAADTTGLTVSEASDFEAARDALFAGNFREASDQFAAFVQTYPGGPMTAEAHYYRGEAHEGLGEMKSAARAYLEAYTAARSGDRAPEALFKLGTALAALGQTTDACAIFGEVGVNFPAASVVADATQARQNLGCA